MHQNQMILFNATILQLKKYESRLTKRILMIKEVSQIVICQQEQIIKEQPQKEMPFKHSWSSKLKGNVFYWDQQRQTEFTRENFFCPYDDDVSWGSSSFCGKPIILWWICDSRYFWSRKHFKRHIMKCFSGFSNLLQKKAFWNCFEVKV